MSRAKQAKLTKAAREARAKVVKFSTLKKEIVADLRALMVAMRLSETRLKKKAKEVSAKIEKFNLINEFGGVGNPALEDDFDFDDACNMVDTALTDILEVER